MREGFRRKETYFGARKYGTGSLAKVGWGIPGRVQLMLIYAGLLSFKAVEIAVSISSCASSKLSTTACRDMARILT